jgi:hypothetical protein
MPADAKSCSRAADNDPLPHRRGSMKTHYAALLAGTMVVAALPAHAQTANTAQTGSQKGTSYDRMVVFGDSLADGGYYLTLDPRLPRDAGSFTTTPIPSPLKCSLHGSDYRWRPSTAKAAPITR